LQTHTLHYLFEKKNRRKRKKNRAENRQLALRHQIASPRSPAPRSPGPRSPAFPHCDIKLHRRAAPPHAEFEAYQRLFCEN